MTDADPIPGQTTVYDFLDDDECVWAQLSVAWAVLTLDYIGPDTASLSKSNPTHTDVPCWLATGRTYRDTTTCGPSTADPGVATSTFSRAASPAKTFPSPANAPDWPAGEAGCSTTSRASQLTLLDPETSFFLRTSPVFCHRTVAEISPSFSRRWTNSGFRISPGECWIAVTSECPNGEGESSSLADVVMAEVAPRFFLSRKAAAGILRRAVRRGRVLPEALRTALEALAHSPDARPDDSTAKPKTSWFNGKPTEAIGSKTSETEHSRPTLAEPTESPSSSVRRLTPTECERLQGLPMGWTAIAWKSTRRRTAGGTRP